MSSGNLRACVSQWSLLACGIIVAQLAIAGDVIRLSEPVEVTATHETFGAPMPNEVEPISLAELLENAPTTATDAVVVEARVAKVCQKKGCFFIAQDGDTVVRVSFKDYGFFVPTDINGRNVTLMGELQRVERSAEEAEHFAEDLGGADADIVPGPQFEIVATAVRVPLDQTDGS